MQRTSLSIRALACAFWFPLCVKCDALNHVPAPKSCQFTIVGGGWAGIYAAWRLVVDERHFEGRDVCMFEAAERFGGRTYTVFGDDIPHLGGLNLDIGAYRFAFQQHLPADLLRGPLNMSTSCYIPSCKPEPLDDDLVLHRLVDPITGDSAGYGSALIKMMAQLSSKGVRMMLRKRLEAIHASGPRDIKLLWAGGDETHSTGVFLNLPRHAVEALSSDSVIFQEAPAPTQQLLRCSAELDGHESMEASVKVYLIYEDAWWISKLSLYEGEVEALETNPPIYIRYHDGPTQCRQHGCRGALLVQYAHTLESGASWYMQFQRDWNQTLGVFTSGPLLTEVHQKLMVMHAEKLQAAGVSPDAMLKPVAAVVGFWSHAKQVTLAPAPDPLSFSSGVPLPSCLHGVSPAAYWQRIRKPILSRHVFLANNDLWLEEPIVDLMPPYWAEVSLRTAERVLHDHMGLKRPPWLNQTYYRRSVLGEALTSEVVI